MANPNFIPAPINRLVASVVWNDFTQLNITPSQLMPEAVELSFNGAPTVNIPALTNVVPSQEPYIQIDMVANIIKTSPLASLFKSQMELSSYLGSCTVRSDAISLGTFQFENVSIVRVERMSFGGREAGFALSFGGVYQINAAMWG